MSNLTQRDQRRIYFTEEELERIVSRLPGENDNREISYVDDENVRHVGTEVFSRLGIVSETFEFNVDVEEMMSRYAPEIPQNLVFRLVLRRMISHLLTVAFGTLSRENMLFRLFFNTFPESEYTTPTITQYDLTVDRFSEKLNEHLQSNDQISANGVWRGYMIMSRLVMDRRRRRIVERNNDTNDVRNDDGDVVLEGQGKKEEYLNNLGLLKIEAKECCLAHAVLLGMSVKDKSDLYRAFLAGFDRYLSQVVKEQLQEIENSCSVDSKTDVDGKKEKKLYSMRKLGNNYLTKKNCLVVYNEMKDKIFDNNCRDISQSEESKVLILFYNDNHFDVVQNVGLFLYGKKVNFCEKCLRKINDANNHICYNKSDCSKCRQVHVKNKNVSTYVVCPLCDNSFGSQFCLQSHYLKSIAVGVRNFEGKRKLSPCDVYKFCFSCMSYVRRFHYVDGKGKKQQHDCKYEYCSVCEVRRPILHMYYLSSDIGINDIFYTHNFDERMNIYVFDFETEANPSNLGIFRPYFGCVYKFCNICLNDSNRKMEYRCCDLNEWVYFEGANTATSFGEFFLKISNGKVKSRWFAHNAGKFDALFVLRFLVCEKNLIPKIIMNGLRILKLTYKNAEILDSMLMCPSLKNVVKMLDLGKNVKKGYFPYDFTDLNYEGPIPDRKCFEISRMNEKELSDFDGWYSQKKQSKYILRNEVKEYCENDVFILTQALVKFHKIILKHTNVEILFNLKVMTISSIALKTFMKMSQLTNLMGVEPPCGYNCGKTLKKQSKIAIRWLNEINEQIFDQMKFRWIYHVLGEKKINNFYVDGYDETTDTIYEFFWVVFITVVISVLMRRRSILSVTRLSVN